VKLTVYIFTGPFGGVRPGQWMEDSLTTFEHNQEFVYPRIPAAARGGLGRIVVVHDCSSALEFLYQIH
jgi:hypothetical protein